jgi:hypothetical protein
MRAAGVGLRAARVRVAAIGGSFLLRTAAGAGFAITLRLPRRRGGITLHDAALDPHEALR